MKKAIAGEWQRARAFCSGRLGSFQGILALALICAGVAFWSVPAALVVAGVLVLVDKVT